MADYVGVLADLRAQRSALAVELTELDAAIKAVEKLVTRMSTSSNLNRVVGGLPLPPHPQAKTLAKGTMPDAIGAYFDSLMLEKPQATRQVVDTLKAAGRNSKNLRGHVYNTLHRLSQPGGPFVRYDDGKWGLRRWREKSGAGPDLLQDAQ